LSTNYFIYLLSIGQRPPDLTRGQPKRTLAVMAGSEIVVPPRGTHKRPPCRQNGELIRRTKPALYLKAVQLLACPEHSFRSVARETGLGLSTLRGIYVAQATTIDEKRALLAKKAEAAIRSLIERVQDTADDMKPRDAIFGVSVLANQWHLLTGSATSHAVNINIAGKSIDIAGQFDKLHAAIDAKAGKVLKIGNDVETANEQPSSRPDPANGSP
jgi:hypothetical protein